MPGIFPDTLADIRTLAHTGRVKRKRKCAFKNFNLHAQFRVWAVCQKWRAHVGQLATVCATPHCPLAFVQPHAPLWCALEFHAFICKDYEMRPVAAKVLYAFPANCRQCFSFVSARVCAWVSPLFPLYPIAFLSFSSCLLVRPPVRFADLLCMQKSVANTQTRLQPRRWEWHAKYFCIKMFAHQHEDRRAEGGASPGRVLATFWQLHLPPNLMCFCAEYGVWKVWRAWKWGNVKF